MNIDSPIASEPDSLGEKEPMHKPRDESSFVRSHSNNTTFTRRRPTNLHRNRSGGHRSSLLSPQSINNLDTEDAQTPDFAMTQSMYEPTGKKEQIEKMTQQSRLMNLMASEKASQAAQKRKIKEMKEKAKEQKKRNEERQKIVDERRVRMLAEEEERRQRLINKFGKTSNITSSCYGSMSQSIKNKVPSESKFLASRPLSSTGKVFGFGSSSPRYICDTIKQGKTNQSNFSSIEMSRESLPTTRMCASQIMGGSIHGDFRGRSHKLPTANISKSTINVSEEVKLRINNKRVASTTANVQLKIPHTTPKNLKNLCSITKTEGTNKRTMESTYRSRTTSRERNYLPKPTRSTNTEPQVISQSKPPGPKSYLTAEKNKRPVSSNDDNKLTHRKERSPSVGKRMKVHSTVQPTIIKTEDNHDKKSEKKVEVRFFTEETVSEQNGKETSDQHPEKQMSTSKNLSKEEYKQKISLHRKLAKEKKLLIEIEKEHNKEKENSELLIEPLTPVDTSITTESEISINILPKDEERTVQSTAVSIDENKIIIKDIHDKRDVDSALPNIEISSEKTEMTASTDELDRLERKKRIESIMLRVKKLPSGSSENVNQHITTSVLQNMMDKGHLSGMSKTAAVLMRNANRSSDLSSSTSDILAVSDKIKTTTSMENLANGNENSDVNRGDCDGKEDSPKEINPALETKSNLMQNLSSGNDGSYFTQWKEKYSVSDSVDSDNTEPI